MFLTKPYNMLLLAPLFLRPPSQRSNNERDYPNDKFVRLIGIYQDQHLEHSKSEHLLIKIKIGEGIYTAAVNIHSTDGSNVQYAVFDQKEIPNPEIGVQTENVTLKYTSPELNLHEDDFKTIVADELYHLLSSLARSSEKIIIYGYSFDDPSNNSKNEVKGVHDIHLNSGESNWTKWRGKPNDGLIGFYSKNHVQWIPIKFQTQYLPS